MLLQKLHIAYAEFTGFCNGKPVDWTISFDEVTLRLNTFNEINEELISLETQYTIESKEDEIAYYKIEKPDFQKFGMVYKMIYDIELKKRPQQIRYYKKQMKKLDKEFTEIEPIVIYYRSKSTDKDDVYFRKSSDQNHIIALVKANEMLVEYLTHKSVGKTADEIIASSPKVKFKINQNDIMELSKGLKEIGAAEGTLKDIAEYLGRCFGVDMKNVYNKSNFISSRLNPFKFIEKMLTALKKTLN
ncbi:MAG: RteC domain-containing protein [Saprospiraceae bacterium]